MDSIHRLASPTIPLVKYKTARAAGFSFCSSKSSKPCSASTDEAGLQSGIFTDQRHVAYLTKNSPAEGECSLRSGPSIFPVSIASLARGRRPFNPGLGHRHNYDGFRRSSIRFPAPFQRTINDAGRHPRIADLTSPMITMESLEDRVSKVHQLALLLYPILS